MWTIDVTHLPLKVDIDQYNIVWMLFVTLAIYYIFKSNNTKLTIIRTNI